MDKRKLMIIDGSSLVHRAFYALPLLTTKGGEYTNGVYGFLTMFYRIREQEQPDYICVAFDRRGPTLRHKDYSEYKGTRDKTPSELSQQFPIIKEVLHHLGIKTVDMDDYEADDIAGTLARLGEERGMDVLLVTGDKDYLQLASDKSDVLITKKGISEIESYNKSRIVEEYGIEPKQFIDVKGLMGDKSDNIPGVPGVGEKTALKLVKEFKDIEGVYENIDSVSGKLKEKLVENKQMAFLSKKLGEIIVNVPLDFSIEDLFVGEENVERLKEIYENLEFKSLLGKLDMEDIESNKEIMSYEIAVIKDPDEIHALAEESREKGKISFKILTEENYFKEKPVCIGVKPEGSKSRLIFFKDIDKEGMELLKGIFEDQIIEKSGLDSKSDLLKTIQMGWDFKGLHFDASIGEYIINPSQSNLSVNKLSEEYFKESGPDIEGELGKGKNRKKVRELESSFIETYMSFVLETIEKLDSKILEIIHERNMDELFNEIEMPLVEVLAYMEYYGVKVDKEELDKLGKVFDSEIKELLSEIFELAGREFNVNSPKQIGEVLFEDLGLPVIKKTKTGYSTNAEVLDELRHEHDIVEKILRYRQLVKLQSTYIEGLRGMIDENTGRIHTRFNQTVTSTGRISSTEPNLQNIPIRSEEGRLIRKAFISQAPDFVFLDGDYSQIELRLLAHISSDPKMMDAFINNEDIHTKTAAEVFGYSKDEVTSDLRYKAKAINFSIIYGISDFSLSKDIGISRKEARKYIDNYFDNYSRVKLYMDDAVAKGKENGYVETLLNRRRYVPELASRNYNIRSFGERVAMNMPIQGSAADIIKMAMVKVFKNLRGNNLRSRLILTIHDELIIEAHKDEADLVKKMMKETMENAVKLNVPLKVDILEGESWYETK
ncbi:DNA polymerase I [Gudongella sp. DL1XJH-153]|uniref:DNA polymerase I n=1 Tax=Gudongella sp. DL1XJH-153 TaxID=3409804 RepID=UPI003BB6599F